jgi:hypothetical protein
MDLTRLTQGEKIAGVSGIALILIMFIFDWYGVEGISGGVDAWEAYSFVDIVLFLAAASAIGLAVMRASQSEMNLPVAASAIVAGLGILAVVLVVIRIIDPPGGGDISGFGVTVEVDVTRKIGVWLGLIAAAGVAFGGYRAMQEEGTTFGGQADRLQDRVSGGGDEPPPPPPPPAGSPPPPSA